MSLIFKKSTAQPEFTVGAAITGTVQVGQTLTCTYTVTKARANNVTVRWYSYFDADGTDQVLIGTGTTYVLTGNELGRYLRAIVTASNPAGTVQSTSSYTAAVTTEVPPDPPTVTSAAAIAGTLEVGQTLTVSVTFSGATSTTYQWYSYTSGTGVGAIPLGTSTTQVLTVNEDGRYIGCQATATNASGSTISAAQIVGPVATVSAGAPESLQTPAISLDAGAVGYNEGEYIVCDAAFSGHTATPSFAWYKCDNAAKANPVLLTGAGEATSQPLPISEPNAFRGALFLAQSLGLNAGGNYVYCVASATNGSGTTSRESSAVGPIGAIQGTAITQAMVGAGPYHLTSAGGTYYLDEDITTDGTAFFFNGSNIILNGNGKTITFDNAASVMPANSDFASGDFTGWNVTNATNASVYAVVDAEDDYNRRRYVKGTHSLKFSSTAHANAGVDEYIIHSTPIVLEQYGWYSLSASVIRSSLAPVYIQLWHDGQLFTERRVTTFATGGDGMQYIEKIFQAYHADPTYELRVGVQGIAGATGDVYFDNIKVSRARTAGVSTVSGTETNKIPSYIYISNAGSGYTDGTYSGVATTRTGGAPLIGSTRPTVNVTVSGGVVTSVELATLTANMQEAGTTFTVSASLIGGTGSGFEFTVGGLALNENAGIQSYYGQANEAPYYNLTLLPLDDTLTTPTSGAGGTVKNCTIVQGQDGGTHPLGVHARYVHRCNITTSGENSQCVFRATGTHDCTITNNNTIISNRDNFYGVSLSDLRGGVYRTSLYNAPAAGMKISDQVSTPAEFIGNYIRAKTRFSNSYGIFLKNAGTVAYDNIIDNTGDYYGRGINVGSNTSAYNNRISIRAARLNSEYYGFSPFGDFAIQVENPSTGAIVDIYDNEINVYATGPNTLNDADLVYAISTSKIKSSATVTVRNNTINCNATGTGYALAWRTSYNNASGGGAVFESNTITTNCGLIQSDNDLYSRHLSNAITLGTVEASDPRFFVLEYGETTVHVANWFIDCALNAAATSQFSSGVTNKSPQFGSGIESGRGGFYLAWTTTFTTGQDGATVTVRDAGDNVVATGTANTSGVAILHVPQYYVSGASPIDYNAGAGLTATATKDALSGSASFVADAAKTVAISMS